MAKRIALFNAKGGIGKSTLAVNLAHGLAKLDFKVLLLDLDAQQDSTHMLGLTESSFNSTFFNLLVNKTNVRRNDFIVSARENLDVITNSNFSKINSHLQAEPRIDLVLEELLEDIEKDYDYIFIDCSPTQSRLNDAILCYVKNIVMPVQLEYNSVRGVGNIYNYLADLRIKTDIIKLVVPNMLNKSINDNKENLDFLKEFFGETDLLTLPVPKRAKLPVSSKNGQTIWEMQDKELEEIFVEILKRMVEEIE